MDKIKKALQLLNEVIGDTGNTELSQYGIKELREITLEEIKRDYPWILEAEIKDAIISEGNTGLVWYDGIWKNGIWEDGTWYNGTWQDGVWLNGTWEDGIWNSKDIHPNDR